MIPGGGDKAFYNSFKRGKELAQEAVKQKPLKTRSFAGDKNNGMDRYLSYPISRSMQEKTGDTLQIKCVEFIPPENGDPFGTKLEGVFNDVTLADGTVKKIMVNDGQPVEFGQTLVLLK